MKKLLIALACLTLGGCASTVVREVKQAEKDGPGIWNMYVYAVRGEWLGGVQTTMSGKSPIAPDEEIINIRTSDHNLLLTNWFKTTIVFKAKIKKSLGVEEGDYVQIRNFMAQDDNSKETPEVTTILCKSQDSACKDKIVLGLQTKDGGTTTGSIVLLPF